MVTRSELPWPKIIGPVHVISVNAKRRKKFTDRCQASDIVISRDVTLCDGIHGKRLNRNQYVSNGWLKASSVLSRGQIGCWESHKALWTKLFESPKMPFIFIAEDDTKIINSKRTRLHATKAFEWVEKFKQGQWDILFLTRSKLKRFTKRMVSKYVGIPGEFWGLNAYVVSQRGARKLLSEPKSHCFDLPVDVVVARMCRANKLDSFCATPCVFDIKAERSGTNNII